MGVISTFTGGNFWAGAASGAFASLAGDLMKAPSDALFDFNPLRSDTGIVLTGAIAGGVGSVLAGGNFWQGAMNGFFVSAFNYLEHRTLEYTIDRELRTAKVDPDGIPKKGDVSEAYRLVKKVPSLRVLNNLSSNLVEFRYSPDLTDFAVTPFKYNGGKTVFLGPLSFSSYRALAIMVGHELMHVYHNVSSMRANWNRKYGELNGHYISEFLAHSWSNSMLQGTNAFSSRDLKNKYWNLAKNFNF